MEEEVNSQATFINLPDEVLIAIFCAIHAPTVILCRRVCKLLRDIIDSSCVLQYHIELYIAGCADGPPENTSPTAERLRLLRHQQAAWKEVNWQRMDTYRVERQSSTYELYGGIYAQGLSARRGGGFGMTRGLKLIEFPSMVRGSTTDHTWTIDDFGFYVKDFGMDPSQDLLVLMESPSMPSPSEPNPPLNVHLAALRRHSYEPHPLAQAPILTWQPTEFHSSYSYWIQVVGDLLAVLFRPSGPAQDLAHPNHNLLFDELVVWNWRKGSQRARIRFHDHVVLSFSFLSEDTFLVPASSNDAVATLCIYQLPTDGTELLPTLLAEYHIPNLKPNCLESSIICRSDPAPWAPTSRDTLRHDRDHNDQPFLKNEPIYKPSNPKPFGPAPGSQIIVLSIWMIMSIHNDAHQGVVQIESRSYVVFVKTQTLLTEWKVNSRAVIRESQDHPPVVTLKWQDWGPANTRWLDEGTDPNWVCFTYGQRYARLLRDRRGVTRLRVLDFNDIPFSKEAPDSKKTGSPKAEDDELGQAGSSDLTEQSPESAIVEAGAAHSEGSISPTPSFNILLGPEGFEGLNNELHVEWMEGEDEDTALEVLAGMEEEEDVGADLEVLSDLDETHSSRASPRDGIVSGMSEIIDEDVFEESVVSSLPYRWSFSSRPEMGRLIRVMMDDERIIGLRGNSEPMNADHSMVIDVFTI